jgi:agmatinase
MPSKTIDHAFTAKSLTGAATDPTHAGALSFMRRKYTKTLRGADAVVWGIPFDAAVSNRPGARFGPQAIRRASAIMDNDPQYPFERDLFENMAVIDYGDCLLDYGNHQKTPATIEREAAKILKSGAFLVSLGGDHFVTWPLLKAHAARHGKLALIQFDAHQDTWFDDGKRIDHGSFVGRAVRDKVIDPDHSIQIGIRTHAPEDCGIEMLHGHEIDEMSAAAIAAAIRRASATWPATSPSTSTASTRPLRRAPARRSRAARHRPRCCRCCASSAISTSRAPTSSRSRRPTIMPTSRRLPVRRWRSIISACSPRNAPDDDTTPK